MPEHLSPEGAAGERMVAENEVVMHQVVTLMLPSVHRDGTDTRTDGVPCAVVR